MNKRARARAKKFLIFLISYINFMPLQNKFKLLIIIKASIYGGKGGEGSG
jgi:hypothetical protein